jgi:hypothetical protein
MPLAISWADVLTNGMPGFVRALESIQKYVNGLEAQQTLLGQQVEHGLAGLTDRVGAGEEVRAAHESRLDDLEYLMSMELMATLIPGDQLHEVVAELRDGWQIRMVRLPVAAPAVLEGAGADEAVERFLREVVLPGTERRFPCDDADGAGALRSRRAAGVGAVLGEGGRE